ncbi:TIM21-domain-containing protein [Lipomyces arxii]|uniref:TIM21-domain-containing protein n=1 Tax=Lipomyces arxii TaxID=56418 RepID=UPI0034CD79F3
MLLQVVCTKSALQKTCLDSQIVLLNSRLFNTTSTSEKFTHLSRSRSSCSKNLTFYRQLLRGYATHKDSSPASTGPSPGFTATPPTSKNYGAMAARLVRRSVTFSFYAVVVGGGLGLSGLVIWSLYDALVKPSGDVQVFENSTSLVESNFDCQKVFGSKMKFHGESDSRWARNRPPASGHSLDRFGNEHLFMRYTVEGNGVLGSVFLEKIRLKDSDKFEYKQLIVEIGKTRIHVISDALDPANKQKKSFSFLGYKLG